MKVTVYDYNRNGVHKEIGMFETSIHEMSQRVAVRGNADREVAFEILKEDSNTNTAKTRGFVVVLQTEVQFHESSVAPSSTFIQNYYSPSPPTTTTPDLTPSTNWQPSQPSLPTLQEV